MKGRMSKDDGQFVFGMDVSPLVVSSESREQGR